MYKLNNKEYKRKEQGPILLENYGDLLIFSSPFLSFTNPYR